MAGRMMTLPMVPLRGLVVLPTMVVNFDVGRPGSTVAVERAMADNQKIFLVAQRSEKVEEPGLKDLYEVGVIANIVQVLKLPGQNVRVLAEGTQRARLAGMEKDADGCLTAKIELLRAPTPRGKQADATVRTAQDLFEDYAKSAPRASEEMVNLIRLETKPGPLADELAGNVVLKWEERQKVLEENDPLKRLEMISSIMMREIELTEAEKDIQSRLRTQMDRSQKEFFLREQIRAIQTELGETDGTDESAMKQKLAEIPLSEEAKAKCEKELDRMARMQPGSPEYTISETYVDWILDMPWGKETEDNLDLKRAREVLDREHYGLEKVKERVIEYLAVLRMKKNMKGPILCFVGPPGVGKTSIVKAVAEAVDRKFVRMSLGGVRDEAEIRGHRKTYIGSMPGRIISGMKQAGTMNPVFLFDEIDKMGSDFRGDPASAMLEVLDAEQNFAFRDHYMEIAFDLSKVMFITTANTVETIPEPLLDRMEIIEVPSYTEEEKLQILKRHLMPKQMEEHGMKKGSIKMTETVMKKMIEGYTREAGVRTLERTMAQVCRKAAVDMLDKNEKTVNVTAARLHEFLGAARYTREPLEKEARVGVVNGLAWTSVGGEMLEVECITMPGKGNLKLTGQLGDVMKESAEAAFSWIRAHGEELELSPEFYQNIDIHVHLPEGAVPKDGPSAGVTLTTAMVSALTGRKARQDVAMTGEMTLRGRVLPIGGLKEKTLAAYRAGIRTLVIPKENHKDLEDIPNYVLERFKVIEVESIDKVLETALYKA